MTSIALLDEIQISVRERRAAGPLAKRQGDVFLEIPHKWAWEGI
jgi:hypothetical protein